MIKLEIEQTYQGCATRIYQDVEQVQEQIIIPNDQCTMGLQVLTKDLRCSNR